MTVDLGGGSSSSNEETRGYRSTFQRFDIWGFKKARNLAFASHNILILEISWTIGSMLLRAVDLLYDFPYRNLEIWMMKSLRFIAFRTPKYRNPKRIHTIGSGEACSRWSPFGGKLWRPQKFRGFEWGKVEVVHHDSPNREKSNKILVGLSAWTLYRVT